METSLLIRVGETPSRDSMSKSCLLLIYGLLTGYFGSDLEAVLRGCEAKYLGEKSLLKQVKKLLSEGDVDRDLTRIHQKIQKAYSKWMVRVAT